MKNLMKKGLALTLALMLALAAFGALAATPNASTISINAKKFPDDAFRAYVQKKFDKDGNKKLDADEIKKITKVDLSDNEDITSVKGIEYFTALKKLILYRTAIEKLDVSKNVELRELDVCEAIMLKSLKLGKLKKLYRLLATDINLASIDIGGCAKLVKMVNVSPYFSDGYISWSASEDDTIVIDKTTKLMNGKKLLREYAKPKSIKFKKSKITLKRDRSFDLAEYLEIKPATSVYPIKFSGNNEKVAYVGEEGTIDTTTKKGTVTVTAKVGSKKTTMKVTTK